MRISMDDTMQNLQTSELRTLVAHSDIMMQELGQIKRAVIGRVYRDEQTAEIAWNGLPAASKQISKEWTGLSATEEIKNQREKLW